MTQTKKNSTAKLAAANERKVAALVLQRLGPLQSALHHALTYLELECKCKSKGKILFPDIEKYYKLIDNT